MVPLTFDVYVIVALLLIGVIVIVLVKALVQFLVPVVAAVVVWLYTHNLMMTGAAFVVVALIQFALKRR